MVPRYHTTELSQKELFMLEHVSVDRSASCTRKPETGCGACRGPSRLWTAKQTCQGWESELLLARGPPMVGCHCAERAAGDLGDYWISIWWQGLNVCKGEGAVSGIFLSFGGKWFQCFENKKDKYLYIHDLNNCKKKKKDTVKFRNVMYIKVFLDEGNGFINWISKMHYVHALKCCDESHYNV